jgi:hypothetical protein
MQADIWSYGLWAERRGLKVEKKQLAVKNGTSNCFGKINGESSVMW